MHRILAELGREHPIGTYATDVIFADFDGCPDWVPPAMRMKYDGINHIRLRSALNDSQEYVKITDFDLME